jgi:hypothetical protein
MQGDGKSKQAERHDEDEAALERERLGGPADYDESGGTGLWGEPSSGTAGSGSGTAGAGSGTAGSRSGGQQGGQDRESGEQSQRG